MPITLLGTAASEGYPNPFCGCVNCEAASRLGGRSLRKRSAALINDDLLIDLGPDLIAACQMYERSLVGLRYCLQTPHADHFDPSHLLSRSPEYGVPDAPRLHFYASPATTRRAAMLLAGNLAPAGLLDRQVGERLNLHVHQVEPLQPFAVGPYAVIAFPANHDPSVESLLYAVEADGRTIFYGTDTAVLSEETWRAFHRLGLRFAVVILDHTYGPNEIGTDHLSAAQFVEHMTRMREEGLATPEARFVATHIAHAGNPPHPQLSAFAAEHGYEVGYDGLTL